MKENRTTFLGLTFKTVIVHTVTYFGMGLLALTFLNYETRFAEPAVRLYMRQTNEPIVALGPALQFIRGILFALAFYPLREILFGRKNGWLVTWLLLVMLSVLATFGAAPGSVEGLLYTTFPVGLQLAGWLEIIPQAFLLSVILFYWVNHPDQKWLSWVLGILYILGIGFSILGFVMS